MCLAKYRWGKIFEEKLYIYIYTSYGNSDCPGNLKKLNK